MSKLENLKQRLKATLSEAKSIAERAEQAGRDLTADERSGIVSKMEQARHLKSQIEEESRAEGVRESLSAMADEFGGHSAVQPGANPYVKATGGGTAEWVRAIRAKAVLTDGIVPVSMPVQTEPVTMGQPALMLRQLIPTETISTPKFSYWRQGARNNGATTVAKGKQKPTSNPGGSLVEGRARTIAHLVTGVDQADLDDASMLSAFIENEMRYGLEVELEDQILNANGETTGNLDNMVGLSNTAGILQQAWATDELTTTRKAITQLNKLGYAPNGWVLSPDDWETIELSPNVNGDFILTNGQSGPPVNRAAQRLWGLPVVVSNSLAAGTGYLADFTKTRLYIRQDWTLRWFESRYDETATATEFELNKLTCRAEGRAGFAVQQPEAVVEITLTDGV